MARGEQAGRKQKHRNMALAVVSLLAFAEQRQGGSWEAQLQAGDHHFGRGELVSEKRLLKVHLLDPN